MIDSKFQSTHPLRGATISDCRYILDELHFNPRTPCGVRRISAVSGDFLANFNPRTPCGVRHFTSATTPGRIWIAIHAPLAGCDPVQPIVRTQPSSFQSTHPLRGATRSADAFLAASLAISIHAPLAGCDDSARYMLPCLNVFQSTHPLRGATARQCCSWWAQGFQSTHPLRGAT